MAANYGPMTQLEATLIASGVPDDNILHNGASKANRIAMEIFDDDLKSCMDISFDDFETECKTLSTLTVANGRIVLLPSVKRNIKALIQWSKDKVITGQDPNALTFPINDAKDYISRYKSHQHFIEKSKSLSDAAKPEKINRNYEMGRLVSHLP